MALSIGELVGYIRLDGGQVRPALQQAERSLRTSGERMGDDAEEAGQRAGSALGEGLARAVNESVRDGRSRLVATAHESGDAAGEALGAALENGARQAGTDAGDTLGEGLTRAVDGSIRDGRGRFVSAARQSGAAAGDALGEALEDGAREGADDAVDAAEGGLSRLQTIAAGAGVAAGGALMVGLSEYLDQSTILGELEGKLGATPAIAQRYGKAAGRLFASAMVEDFQTAADTMAAISQAGFVPPETTERQLARIGERIAVTARTLGEEVAGVTATVGKMIKTGMAKDADQAMDILVKAQQRGLNASEDLLDTFDEYSTQFRKVGIDGPMAMGLVSQALAGGARDTDIAADAIKEFSLLSIDGSAGAVAAYKTLGLSSKKMIATLAAGGPGATKAMDTIFDKIRGLKDPVDKNTVAIGLFGTKFEDLGAAFDYMDPSAAIAEFGAFKGSVDAAGKAISDSAGVRVERFKRAISQGIVNVIGAQAIPAMMKFGGWAQKNSGTLKVVAGVAAGVLVPALVLMGVTATVRGAQVAAGWVTSGAASLGSAGTQVAAGARVVGTWLLMGGRAVVSAAGVVGGWVATGVAAAGSAAAQVLAGARVVGAWLLMGAQSLIQGARMAAAWVIGMGPVGWVIAVLVGLGLLIWKNWDKITKWTGQAWDWIWGKIKAVGVSIVTTVAGFIAGALQKWDGLQRGVATKTIALIGFVTGLPGRISRGIGSLNSLLLQKGRNVVQGLWQGIQSMGGWIKSQIMSWATSVIPGPIAKALGIASPSKVTKAQGRWIARGLVDGLTGSAAQVRAATAKIADIVTDSLKPGKTRSRALGRISADSKKLIALANREATVAARLKTAQKQLADQIAARDKLAADVKKGVLDSANITSMEGASSADSIIQTLAARVSQAQTFAAQLAALTKKGIRADLVAQIASAGVDQGAAAAATLASASSSQVKQLNSTQAALVTAAGKAGSTAGNAMYGAGINAAQGLVKGLQSQQKAIERQMLTIAKGMTKAIRQALGIKSPSRVMAAIGRFIPRGLVQGIDGSRSIVDRSMAGLVDPSAVLTPAGLGAAGAAGQAGSTSPTSSTSIPRTIIEIRSSGSRRDDQLLEELRAAIKIRGGDVQLVLAGKKAS
ncbi:phage tail tape measure protein [Streptomyces sp. AM 2-1-1]|uniref:phage tail tape measure protein n=1 Tax=Streptomyces sp. AM 2-1-1 TaxID=3028709 RepID=UPI0023B9A505|nr:phage tail tape measure protein [Streptomyces sp. AM 2-1-1]WEH40803.1 phage tail tape measure protein [Streptomyces sp. AM 2-1-1]